MSNLEESLGPDYVAFNSVHNAVQACVEMLGARSHMIVAIVPVTTEPEILSGIMRGGAHPMMLDTDEHGFGYDPEGLQEALEELEGAAVVFVPRTSKTREGSQVSALLEGVPTVILNQHTPGNGYYWMNSPGDFELYYLSPWIDCGAVIQSRYPEQLEDLRMVRSGTLGLNAELPWCLDKEAASWRKTPVLSVRMERKPLHLVPDVARRWMEAPSYPNAEAFYERTTNDAERANSGAEPETD